MKGFKVRLYPYHSGVCIVVSSEIAPNMWYDGPEIKVIERQNGISLATEVKQRVSDEIKRLKEEDRRLKEYTDLARSLELELNSELKTHT